MAAGARHSLLIDSVNNRSTASKQIVNMIEPDRLTKEEMLESQIIYPELDQAEAVDTYRELRTKLLQLSNGENRITMISSVTPESGSSQVALNIAAAFAFDETKTALVMDCNIRRPSLDKRLNLSPQHGLTDFLENDSVSLDSVIYATGIHRLRYIPVGQRREHSSEYFTSMRMRALLDVLKNRYPDRHIFLDAPPIGVSADARILASLADQVVIIVPYGKVQPSQIQVAVEAIDRQKLIGMIVSE